MLARWGSGPCSLLGPRLPRTPKCHTDAGISSDPCLAMARYALPSRLCLCTQTHAGLHVKQLVINKKIDPGSGKAKTHAVLSFDELAILLDDEQYKDMLMIANMFDMLVRQQKVCMKRRSLPAASSQRLIFSPIQYRQYRPPPDETPSKNPRAWLLYACMGLTCFEAAVAVSAMVCTHVRHLESRSYVHPGGDPREATQVDLGLFPRTARRPQGLRGSVHAVQARASQVLGNHHTCPV